MVLMDDEKLSKWCSTHSLILENETLQLTVSTDIYVVFEVPESSRDQILFSGDLLSLGGFEKWTEDMIWISNWEKWNDWNRHLGETIISRLRSTESEIVPLDSVSAQIFSFDERTISVAIFLQLMLFRWDGWLASGNADYLVQCSHDGLIWITCRTHEIQRRITSELRAWKPQIRPMSAN